ncbi:hypothetical protein ZWY2020_057901 [Hordeum vulgare]|nr:hypothetical protein ZWY2020_057901 [Hordeum vulgare]
MLMRRKATSAIVAEEDETTHVIKIDGYSRTKERLKCGSFTKSIPFIAGDHIWVVMFFPNGNNHSTGFISGHISVYLALDSADAKDVKAASTFSLLDKGGEPVPSYIKTLNEHIFPSKGSDFGFTNFIKHKDLEGPLHLIGDSFRIRCDVTVIKKIRCEETHHANQFVVVPHVALFM